MPEIYPKNEKWNLIFFDGMWYPYLIKMNVVLQVNKIDAECLQRKKKLTFNEI